MKLLNLSPYLIPNMNVILLFGLIIFGCSAMTLFSNDFDRVNQQFSAGDFTGAVAGYEKILKDEGPRASVYYNLGNSYQQLKQYGPAILAYERARVLSPQDPDLLANLTRARKAAAAFQDAGPTPWLDVITHRFSRNTWSWWVVLGAWFLAGLALAYMRFSLPRREVLIAAGGGVFIIVLASVSLYIRRDESERGIVLSEDATVRLSPFSSAESLGTPGPGRLVRLGEKSGDFQYVEVLGTSLHGWLANKDVASIIPSK